MKKNKFQMLLDVGIQLSAEKDHDKLLETILIAAMDITGADGGTLYICGDNCLEFKIMITRSMNYFKGGRAGKIELPPVKLDPGNVCAAAVLNRKLFNFPDVYNCDTFDFSGPRNYDKMTGYKTTSVMVVPMENDDSEIIGALQLINATNEDGEVGPFDESDERVISSLAAQAAICLTNMNYVTQINELLHSFVRVMSTGIDARTPYNANHTRNMVKYGERFFRYETEQGGRWSVSDAEKDEILLSVWLHDIGKLITPLEIMDKSTRLGPALKDVEYRFERQMLLARLAAAEGRITPEERDARLAGLSEDLELIRATDKAGFLPDDWMEKILAIGKKTVTEEDGTAVPLLTDAELTQLSIRKGTLTDDERKIMEGHVSMTSRMLSELEFPKNYSHVAFYAGSHHEYLNGRGYPNHLTAEQLPWQIRLLTILDVYDALTARDRPYKPPMPEEKAFGILDSMVSDGQMDGEILAEFKDAMRATAEKAAE